jgi:sensor histidine kinase regulating citrate/malate metabolism
VWLSEFPLIGSHNSNSQIDNGLGIDLEKYEKDFFGMYKTFHGNPDAQGIGLFITKYQVEAMGGEITVESKVEKGINFKVYFRE